MVGGDVALLELQHVSKFFGGGGMFNQRKVAALNDFSLVIDSQHPYTRQLMDSLPTLHDRGSFEAGMLAEPA